MTASSVPSVYLVIEVCLSKVMVLGPVSTRCPGSSLPLAVWSMSMSMSPLLSPNSHWILC